jgi:hypothetical protein
VAVGVGVAVGIAKTKLYTVQETLPAPGLAFNIILNLAAVG